MTKIKGTLIITLSVMPAQAGIHVSETYGFPPARE
jgi:hypothetical protein